MLRNVKNNGSTQFETCGLVNEKNDWTPKTSWYYTYTMKNILKDKYFAGELESGNEEVMVYTYKNAARDTTVYAVWAPTSAATIISSYVLRLSVPVYSAWKTELTHGSTQGTTNRLEPQKNTVTIQVTEKPVFIVTSSNPVVSDREPGSETDDLIVFPNPVNDIVSLRFNAMKPVNGLA